MRRFEFKQPHSLDEALRELEIYAGDARPIAGGQSLLLQMKDRAQCPRILVSLSELEELHGKKMDGETYVIGPTTTYRELDSAAPAGPYRALGSVASNIADIPVRTMATIGGAICQADPRFDMPVVQVTLNAELTLRSSRGERRVSAEEFFLGTAATAAEPDELLTSIALPPANRDFRWSFRKFRMRSMDAAQVSVGTAYRSDECGVIREPVVVVGGCVDKPRRMADIEATMQGEALTEELAAEVAAQMTSQLKPTVSGWPFLEKDYLARTGGVLIARALRDMSNTPDTERLQGAGVGTN